MSKIKLLQRQLDLFNLLVSVRGKETILRLQADNTDTWGQEFEFMNNLSINDVARLLYDPDSCEIELEFKVNDLIVDEFGELIKVKRSGKYGIYIDYGFIGSETNTYNMLRHATPEERFFYEHDRKPWELKEGDILKSIKSGRIIEVANSRNDGNTISFSGYRLDYTLESIRKSCIILYFEEGRKDV